MAYIQLLYVDNTISRKQRQVEQVLCFYMQVQSLAYEKQVEVVWAGQDGQWQTLSASFQHRLDEQEFWLAELSIQATKVTDLPGQIQFGLRYQSQGQTFWDNQNGAQYLSAANAGLQLAAGIPLLTIGFTESLADDQKLLPITVAVDPELQAKKVVVVWTTDNWQHTHRTACHLKKQSSRARQHSAQLWTTTLKVAQDYRVQYCLVCEAKHQHYWDNHYGHNYTVSRKPLKILILNLHCYQEDQQDQKFWQIAKAIDDHAVDIVCLQEVAELWNNGQGDWASNSARIINERLSQPMHLHTDWSHLGFDKYREGVAILSRFPMHKQESGYVSTSHDCFSIHSRKVVMAQVQVPGMGLINVFSAHLSWWEDGFAEQFHRLSRWAAHKHTKFVRTTLLCGDFNIEAGSKGYDLVVKANEYEDQFLAANSQGVFEKIFKVHDPHWQHYLSDDYRIDYVFKDKASTLQVKSAMVLFTDYDYGRVSDHCGYLLVFEPH